MLWLGLLSGAALAASALPSAPPFARSLVWTEKGAEFETLSSQPISCLAKGTNPASVQYGRALFNTPTLLGGQAAKAGLNCNSCHISGRDNLHFMLPQLSSVSGTADVSSSFFSAARGNGKFDPVKIPDLAMPGKISRDPSSDKLERFIRNLVVEEFSGHEPSKTTLSALAAYVRAIRNCEGSPERGPHRLEDQRLEDQLALISSAVDGAANMAKAGEYGTADLLIAAARHQLGLIHERYGARGLKRQQKMLLKSSIDLQTTTDLPKWQADFDRNVAPALRQAESKSAYNPAILRKLLAPS